MISLWRVPNVSAEYGFVYFTTESERLREFISRSWAVSWASSLFTKEENIKPFQLADGYYYDGRRKGSECFIRPKNWGIFDLLGHESKGTIR